jgi:hypothetical protein
MSQDKHTFWVAREKDSEYLELFQGEKPRRGHKGILNGNQIAWLDENDPIGQSLTGKDEPREVVLVEKEEMARLEQENHELKEDNKRLVEALKLSCDDCETLKTENQRLKILIEEIQLVICDRCTRFNKACISCRWNDSKLKQILKHATGEE